MEGATQLVSIVGQPVGKEYQQLSSVGGQVAELTDELDTMNAILRMLAEAEDGAVDHFIRVWMKQVRELAYDAEDCVHLYILRIRCGPRNHLVVWSKRMVATLLPRRRLARQIQALRARAVAISERHARYGVSREALLQGSTSTLAPPAPAPGHGLGPPAPNHSAHLVGITEQADELSNMMKAVGENDHDKNLKVFSIWGFGGLGKTTLAIEVCRKLEVEFPHQAQVSVSQAFGGTKDLKGLLKRVLQQMVKPKADNAQGIKIEDDPLNGIDEMDVDKLTAKLQELLGKDKRYLIVVDDVWTVATWQAIRSKLPENENGSRVIVTTRIETVAKACSDASVYGHHVHQMKPLVFDESKKLFISRVFGSEDTTNHSDLDEEMGKILKKCGGLPMAIISIAGLLAKYNSSESKDMWKRVCKSIGSQMESHPTLEGMKQIVTLSYNHLHYYLKGCMMYFSIFPEDYVIVKNRLLRRWIAEGLVAEIRGLTLMEVAEAYYNELVSRSLIDRAGDIVNNRDGRVETCRVHDMVLEVMVSKSLEANFVSLVGGPYEGMSYDSIRRLSIHGGEHPATAVDNPSNKVAAWQGRKNGIKGMSMEHVRSLSMFDLEGQTNVLDRLNEFTLLRVLDLEDCKGIKAKHLKKICQMYLLRFLSLRGTDITVMPKQVGQLENLETLDVRETYLEDLPKTVSKLEKLEHLHISNKSNYKCWTARQGIGRMKALRTINYVAFESDADAAEELAELQQLRELRILLTIVYHDPFHQDLKQNIARALSRMYSLRWLDIGAEKDKRSLDFLHDLDPPPRLLQYLRIAGGIDKLPHWVRSLNNLVELFIGWTEFVDDQLFSPVCELPNLKHINLDWQYYVDKELVAKASYRFPALKDLHLIFNVHNMEVLRFEEKSMTKLEKLQVNFLDYKSKKVEGMDHLKSLKEVVLEGKKDNPSLHCAVEQLKTMNEKRQKTDQLKVVVKYE